ncbi:MAG: M20 family metallopeptidase [Anaerolineales bacterium]
MEVLELSRQLLRFNTVNPPGDESACARHLGRVLEAAGFTVAAFEFAPGRTSLVARQGGSAGRAPLCFAGHLDTVPLGAAAWGFNPFGGEIADGRLYGRGSSDMKAGVAAFVTAAIRLAGGLLGTPGLVLVITAGEETGCDGARHLAALPGVLGEAGALVIAEPTGNHPCVGHKGALWLEGRATGVTAHGSMPERGINAIYKAARAVRALEGFDFEAAPHPALGTPTLNVGTIAGGLNINSVPDEVILGVDIRTLPGQRHGALRQRLTQHVGDEIAWSTLVDVEAVWTDPADPWIQAVFDHAGPIVGARPAVRGAPYFTDAAVLTPAYGSPPTVILGPGEMELAHQTDEYCRIDRIEQAAALYVEIARGWCGL